MALKVWMHFHSVLVLSIVQVAILSAVDFHVLLVEEIVQTSVKLVQVLHDHDVAQTDVALHGGQKVKTVFFSFDTSPIDDLVFLLGELSEFFKENIVHTTSPSDFTSKNLEFISLMFWLIRSRQSTQIGNPLRKAWHLPYQ
jgi:hypothetical protein